MTKNAIPLEWGPQSISDSVFARKARLLQSWYRYTILDEPNYGVGPAETNRNKYGNIIENGKTSGKNFLSVEIFEYAEYRLKNRIKGETFDEYRLFNNMLGSQTMCFNLFVPLKKLFSKNIENVAKIFSACFPSLDIAKVLAIELEFLPYPKDEYLDDGTAFDAFIIFKNSAGARNLLVVETKYIEKLGSNSSTNLKPQIETASNSGLFNDAGIEAANNGLSQLGRNFLLAQKYTEVHKLNNFYAVVISPEENNSSKIEIESFKKLLNPSAHEILLYKSLEEFVDTINGTCPDEMITWITDFKRRYLGFDNISVYNK